MRKRKLYLSELLNRHIPKSYQFICIFIQHKLVYDKGSCWQRNKNDIPEDYLDKQVKQWEVIDNNINIYL